MRSRTWWAITGMSHVACSLFGEPKFFNVETGTWWKHAGEATKFASRSRAVAAAEEFGLASDGRVHLLDGYDLQQFHEEQPPTSTIGEDQDDAEWWKQE